MSSVCVLDVKYEPRVDDRLENIKTRRLAEFRYFTIDRRAEVHILHLEHNTDNMNFFLNLYKYY